MDWDRGGSGWVLGKGSSPRDGGQALGQAAQGSGPGKLTLLTANSWSHTILGSRPKPKADQAAQLTYTERRVLSPHRLEGQCLKVLSKVFHSLFSVLCALLHL
uniref:Uncharacterized protein n=1 Tax=Anas zonorhyncha TaxID=75864 RepID=A0A8B9UZW9_9AVES